MTEIDLIGMTKEQLRLLVGKPGMPSTLRGIRRRQWEQFVARGKEDNARSILPKYQSARAVLAHRTPHRAANVPPSPFETNLPVVDGQRVNALLDEEAEVEAQIAELRQRISAIREELADHLGPGCKLGLGREYVRRRKRENLREDAAVLRLMHWLGALDYASYWERALDLINRSVFDWKPRVKLYKHKMRR